MPINNTYEYFIWLTGCTYSTDGVKGWGIAGVGGGRRCCAVMSVAAFHYHSTDCGWDWSQLPFALCNSPACLTKYINTANRRADCNLYPFPRCLFTAFFVISLWQRLHLYSFNWPHGFTVVAYVVYIRCIFIYKYMVACCKCQL